MDISAQKFCCRRTSTKYIVSVQRMKVCKALSEAGSEEFLFFFFFVLSEPFPSNTVLVSERGVDFLGNRSSFPPQTLELNVLFVGSPLVVMILLLKERTETA